MPPEAAALAPEARAEWLRGDAVLVRQKRIGQELLDWAERKQGAEWIDAALDAWGVHEDEDIDEGAADLFTTWSLFNFTSPAFGQRIAAAWLDDAAGRKADGDTRALVTASLGAPLGLWQVETVEAGVGATITDRLSDTTHFVHEPDLTHDIAPGEFILAYVVEVDGVRVFSGLHADSLLFMDGKEVMTSVLADAGVEEGALPRDRQTDPAWQARLARQWGETADRAYGEPDDGEADER